MLEKLLKQRCDSLIKESSDIFSAAHLRQYRIIQVCGLRSKIFGQSDETIFKQGVRRELCGVALIRNLGFVELFEMS